MSKFNYSEKVLPCHTDKVKWEESQMRRIKDVQLLSYRIVYTYTV